MHAMATNEICQPAATDIIGGPVGCGIGDADLRQHSLHLQIEEPVDDEHQGPPAGHIGN